MQILQTKMYEESKVILKLGEDFKRYQLQDFHCSGNFSLDSEMLFLIAKKNGFDEWAWTGNFNECTKTIEALFRKNVAEELHENINMQEKEDDECYGQTNDNGRTI